MLEFDLFSDVNFHFFNVRRCTVTSFSRVKTFEIHVNASVTVKVPGGVSFQVIAENWKQLKDTLAFSSVFLCVRIEIESW